MMGTIRPVCFFLTDAGVVAEAEVGVCVCVSPLRGETCPIKGFCLSSMLSFLFIS